jgi:hypothetical protein
MDEFYSASLATRTTHRKSKDRLFLFPVFPIVKKPFSFLLILFRINIIWYIPMSIMPFSSQFALSLELTRLIPVSLTVASTAAEALLRLARDLQVTRLYHVSITR